MMQQLCLFAIMFLTLSLVCGQVARANFEDDEVIAIKSLLDAVKSPTAGRLW